MPLPFVPHPQARHLLPGNRALGAALRARGREVHALRRRGADLGYALPLHRRYPDATTARARWQAGEPVFLPGVVAAGLPRQATAIAATLQMFERMRRGGRFLDEVETRLRAHDEFRYAGSTVDRQDRREIERVFVDAEVRSRTVAEDLWAKLTWIADDEHDVSLRIRFSAGLEQLEAWQLVGDRTAGWVDILARSMFPECAAVLGSRPLLDQLADLLPGPWRLSERIVYNNAPDGGAVFHHDAETGQLGVVFSQLEGRTAWLAISKRRLADLLARRGTAPDQRRAMAALDAGERTLWHLLNRDAGFTGELAAHGALFVLQAGDSILLPSHGFDDVAWHSVLALGERPSLAHSYGIFRRRAGYPVAGMASAG